MKYTLTINQNRSVEWNLTSSEAVVFSWIYELPSWADKLEYNGNTYYFGSRNIACKELPLVTDKPDTMYRLYKSLEKKQLISMITLMKKDYIALTEKGKSWYYESELPNDGKISEETRNNIRENSEKNPTNKYTNDKDTNDKNIIGKKEETKNDNQESQENDFIERMYDIYPSKCPCRNQYLGKSKKDKDRIKKLLKSYSMEQIESVIRKEVEDKYGKSYMQNFSTFLNNFPDPNCLFDSNDPYLKKDNDELIINGVKYQ